ncbi:hypothetical protein ACFPFQ_08780 [Pseudonocardia sp. GCM10023141]
MVGSGGHSLTVVQAQQLALARLVLADPPVAILDEATAEAGSSGARVLEAAAKRATAGRTGLLVAHGSPRPPARIRWWSTAPTRNWWRRAGAVPTSGRRGATTADRAPAAAQQGRGPVAAWAATATGPSRRPLADPSRPAR